MYHKTGKFLLIEALTLTDVTMITTTMTCNCSYYLHIDLVKHFEKRKWQFARPVLEKNKRTEKQNCEVEQQGQSKEQLPLV
jgi:hypothetical protein